MQENIENFVDYFGIEHCFEFTVTACRLSPAEFGKRMNSFITDCLREIMPARIGVVEPHESGHAHTHTLVSLPFTSPNFDHEALALSRKAFNEKRFSESKRQWAKVKASMSPEHLEMWEYLREKLPKYGLGGQIGFAPVRDSARAIACYFGKYLTKGIASRPDDWRNVRLVRYSGTNGREIPPWKCSTPHRSGNSVHDQNRRDKLRAVARECGCTSSEDMKLLLGRHWHFHARELVSRVQLPVYRSFLHASGDGLTLAMPEDARLVALPLVPDDPLSGGTGMFLPPESFLPYRPPPEAKRADGCTPKEIAEVLLEQARATRPSIPRILRRNICGF